ncbi:hypothetical protein [Maribellus maritimus]|uniref:hypothetical protein n=1 Tax=Maribellus maritimus TaxID=2870838 RepID=UPI001EEA6582|nr:hypothetical protein [Maribellus maritimus]MCG6188716.1 hypothetical protein [Maribellus maritimus]
MKRIILLSIVALAFVVDSFSQNAGDGRTPQERAQFQTQWMKDNLELDEQQLGVIDSLNLKYALKMEEIRSMPGRLNKLKKARLIIEEKDTKLKEILTDIQFETYQGKRKELRKKMHEKHADG